MKRTSSRRTQSPGRPALRTLIVEDNPGDAAMARQSLGRREERFELELADRLAVALERLAARPVDVILLDLGLPDSQGLETLERVRAQSPETPVVLLTGAADEAQAVSAIERGAQDYLVKGVAQWGALPRVLRFAVERKRAELLARADADRERFASVAAHDLREPMDRILADVQVLARRHGAELGARGRGLLASMAASARETRRQLAELGELSRIAEADGALRLVDFNLVASRVIESLQGERAWAGAVSIETERLPTAMACPEQARRLLEHLLSNALRAGPRDGPRRLRLSARRLPGELVELSVRDDAGRPGEPAAGGPSSRAPESRAWRLGAGRTPWWAIALRHGGWVTVRGAGPGAALSVSLPLRRTS